MAEAESVVKGSKKAERALKRAEQNVKSKLYALRVTEERLQKASLTHAAAWKTHALALHEWSELRFGAWPKK